MTKGDRLQELIDRYKAKVDPELCADYRPFKGWYLIGQPRHFGDEGDYMGRNYQEARAFLEWLFKDLLRY